MPTRTLNSHHILNYYLFVANTHTPVLFFSSHGRVYKEKVWRLPQAAPQSRGKALINILPLEQGELITTIMPLPEDESTWGQLDVMFATTRGTCGATSSPTSSTCAAPASSR